MTTPVPASPRRCASGLLPLAPHPSPSPSSSPSPALHISRILARSPAHPLTLPRPRRPPLRQPSRLSHPRRQHRLRSIKRLALRPPLPCDAGANHPPKPSNSLPCPLRPRQEHVVTMHPDTLLRAAQRWRRPRYSARPFALTILAIALISLLAWAKTQAAPNPASPGPLRKREVPVLDQEVGGDSAPARLCTQHADCCPVSPGTSRPRSMRFCPCKLSR